MATIASRSLQKYRPLLIGALLCLSLYAALPLVADAAPIIKSCPISPTVPAGANAAAYTEGYEAGCILSVTSYAGSLDNNAYCTIGKAPSAYFVTRKSDWVSGCDAGYTENTSLQSQNLSSLSTTLSKLEQRCASVNKNDCMMGSLGRVSNLTRAQSCRFFTTLIEACTVGYSDVQSIYFGSTASTNYPIPTIDEATEVAAAKQDNCNLENTIRFGDPSINNEAYKRGHKKGCVIGYDHAFNVAHVKASEKDPFCRKLAGDGATYENPNELSFQQGVAGGCMNGIQRAWTLKLPPPVPQTVLDMASEDLGNCGFTEEPRNTRVRDGWAQGCVDGYVREKETGFAAVDCNDNHDIEDPYVNYAEFNVAYREACKAGLQLAQEDRRNNKPGGRIGGMGNNTGEGLVPDCDPSLPPSARRACGLDKAIELIKNIMNYLFMIAIPIAVLALGWGGFQIMTAAGNAGKAEEGVSTMKVAVIGIVIMLSSYLVVQFIFKALGVTNDFTRFF